MDAALDDRARLLEAARRLLSEAGPEGLSVRKLAREAGCSTMGVYSSFGGKPGLLDALFAEGFDRLAAAWAQVGSGPPRARLLALALVLRAVALSHPEHYALMMGRLPGFTPSEAARGAARATLEPVVRAAAEAQAAGEVRGSDAPGLAHALVSACHGLTSLELAGWSPHPEEAAGRYRAAVEALLDGWTR